MNLPNNQLTFSAILFILSIVSGLWLRKLGNPYPTFLVTIHKLLSLATLILLILSYLSIRKGYVLSYNSIKILVISGGIYVLSLASGALLTNTKTFSGAMQVAHRVTTLLFLLAIITASFIIYRNAR